MNQNTTKGRSIPPKKISIASEYIHLYESKGLDLRKRNEELKKIMQKKNDSGFIEGLIIFKELLKYRILDLLKKSKLE